MTSDSNEPKPSRKEREFVARRNEILDAATRLFARQGYHGTTMGEIAREAEFSTGSLYNFFKNKEELYFKLLEEKIGALEIQVDKILEEEGGIEGRLGRYVDTILGFFEVERDFFRIFSEHRSQFELSAKGQFADVIQEKYENYLGAMVELMQQGIEEGLFKPLNPAELALCFVGTINSILFMFINSEEPYELREKARVILDIFFNGTRREGGED